MSDHFDSDLTFMSDFSELNLSKDDGVPKDPVKVDIGLPPVYCKDPNLSLTPEPTTIKQVRFSPSVDAPIQLRSCPEDGNDQSEEDSELDKQVLRYKTSSSTLDCGPPPVIYVHRNPAPLIGKVRGNLDPSLKPIPPRTEEPHSPLPDLVDDEHSICVVTDSSNPMAHPRPHTTERIAERITKMEETPIDAREIVEERLRASPELRQQLKDKTSEVLNVDDDEKLYANLIDLEVPVEELIDRLGRERERLHRADMKSNKSDLPVPDPMEFFSESMIHQSADLTLRHLPNLLPGLSLVPKEDDGTLYREYCEEIGLI